jgi:arylsulfatase A
MKKLAISLIGILIVSSQATAATKPNIVLIMADDMGYECIQANGSLDYQTPQIDRLAASGLRFEHCYSQPICTPSRVKLMTGMSNKRNYIQFGKLDRSQTTFAHILKDAGYKTCIAGKWQLGKQADSPQHFGFEQSLLWQHTRSRTDKQKHDTRYPNPRLELNGKPMDYDEGEFSSDLFVDFISQFMENNRDRPFLVYYPMALVHCPFSPTPDSEDWDPKSHGSKSYKGDPQYFADMVAYVDKTVAKVNAKLDELGVRDNTLLIFTGDNGTDTPIVTNTTFGKVIGAKGQMTDGGNHVPCVISWPSVIRKGRVVQDIIDFSDMLPTICEAADAKVPSKLTIDGQSFLPQLRGESGTPRDSIYMWYSRNGNAKAARAFARNQRYKLYESGEFFDIAKDRMEKNPQNADSLSDEQRSIKALLQMRIDRFESVTPPGAKK